MLDEHDWKAGYHDDTEGDETTHWTCKNCGAGYWCKWLPEKDMKLSYQTGPRQEGINTLELLSCNEIVCLKIQIE
jgi:hypothetical protein